MPRCARGAGRWIVVGWPARRSAGGGWERVEPRERGGQVRHPWPIALKVQLGAACGECEPARDVQQAVAQTLGLGRGELAVEQQRLGPGDQVVGEQHDLEPHLVERERFERELGQARVLVVADAVLDVRTLAVTALELRDVVVRLVGEDRLEAVAIVVGE
jgi:hypothetical protein